MVVQPARHAVEIPPFPRIAGLPRHVAVIMDGNGRWATARGLSRQEGHRAGTLAIRNVAERLSQHGVPVLTLFAFSTENWGRPRAEVDAILRLAGDFLDTRLAELDEADFRLAHIGEIERLPRGLRGKVRRAVKRTSGNGGLLLNVAFNYGGRADIVEAVRRLVAEGVRAEDVTESAIAERLATAHLPEPDLVIRTGGERRISNFVVWQAAYAEYYFTPTLWPDFDAAAVDSALVEYGRRVRRFGLVPESRASDVLTISAGR